MDGERWRQIEDIYHRAAAQPPGEREAFLAAVCGSDQALRKEVQLLLQQSTSAAGWFDRAAALAPPVGAPLRDGQRLGDYEIRGLLGTGGMGQVHRAYDTRLRREVAIKVLPLPFLNDGDRLTRFEREARVLASLNHPNVGAIYGLEEASADSGDPIRALVLELVEGPTLADRIARGALRVAEATKIAVQIADALEAAHEKGIVHRDVKPANIKITPQGAVKVLDFGIATAVGAPESSALTNAPTAEGEHTQPGTLIGTVSYMSPE